VGYDRVIVGRLFSTTKNTKGHETFLKLIQYFLIIDASVSFLLAALGPNFIRAYPPASYFGCDVYAVLDFHLLPVCGYRVESLFAGGL